MRAFPIVVAGHVDHGKSTLIGRLLHDTDSLADGQLEQIQAASKGRSDALEWSFLLDALSVERDLGITLDISQIWFRTRQRRYVIIDAPGHREFLRNMISGAASADAALLVVDVTEGVSEQTRRHAFLLQLLGIRQVAVVVNKLDKVGFDAGRFAAVRDAVAAYLAAIGIAAVAIIPASARHGDMIAGRGHAMAWYDGPTVVEALDGFAASGARQDAALRLPVQDVYRFDERRILVGRLETGRLKVGDTVLVHPSGRTARIASFETWNGVPKIAAQAGESVAVTLEGPAFVERGALLAAPGDTAPVPGDRLAVRLFWFGAEPLQPGRRLTLRVGPMEQAVTVAAIERVVDVQDLSDGAGMAVERDGVADVVLIAAAPMALDRLADNPATGRGVLADGNRVIAGCVVTGVARADQAASLVPPTEAVTLDQRARRQGHRGGVVWLTGLSGAGKSTLAMAAHERLFAAGLQAHVLDADHIRQGLCRDLGFSPEDRAENVRRVAEVAKLFAEAGLVALVAIIAPRAADRQVARQIVGDGFLEVHVDADLATCQARDPKQHYARAAAGELRQFTGVSAPYEPPAEPDLRIDTAAASIDAAASSLVAAIRARFADPG